MKLYECDDKALETAREIMRLAYGPMPIGGSVQLLAQIQVLVTDAMLLSSVEPAKQKSGEKNGICISNRTETFQG